MLKLSGVNKVFGDFKAVKEVNIEIPQGQMVGVIGRSGAGKSTMLRMINRMTDPSSGQILFEGQDITQLKGKALREWRSDCAMIFQQFNLVDRMDVLTNVMLGRIAQQSFLPSMFKKFSDEDRAIAVNALERLDLLPKALDRASSLSGGQQQRVAIAKALVQQPKVMLADEPIASLDPANATKVMNALARINNEDKITVLVNLHTLDTARKYCDRIIAMRDGQVWFDGSADELTQDKVIEIYGAEGLEELDESITSTSADVKPVLKPQDAPAFA